MNEDPASVAARVAELCGARRGPEALAIARALADAHPSSAEAANALGNALAATGDAAGAEAAYERAIALDPALGKPWVNLATIAQRRGDAASAMRLLGEAIARDGGSFRAHASLGALLRDAGRVDEAIASFERSLACKPTPTVAHNAAALLASRGRIDEAIARAAQAVALDPRATESARLLGLLEAQRALSRDAPLVAAGHVARAREAAGPASPLDGEIARLAAALAPTVASAALAEKRAGRLDDAEALFRRAIALERFDARAHANLALTVLPLGRAREALDHLRRARELAPTLPGIDELELLLLHYTTDSSPRAVFEAHARWGARLAATPRLALPARSAAPERPLRVGYVSPDLRDHSVAHFLLPVLEAHDPRVVTVFAYANVHAPDAVTDRFRALPLSYRSIADRDDDAVARLVVADGIDVLVDVAGHMADGRLGVFARKPAPIQLTWLGYPDTTGLAAIDGRLTDAVADPPGEADAFAVEALVRLPRTAWTFRPLHAAPAPRPRDEGRPITFGGFNNLAKVGPDALAAWAELLAATPDARLVLKCRGLGSASAAAATRAAFAARGVADRVDLLGWEPDARGHLAAYHAVDVALDTFPYGGTTTTCEALFMGVPVVTLAGDRHAARVGASLLRAVGLDDLVARDVAGYVDRARALAADRARLASLRAGLRARFEASPLGDATAFTRDLEATYRALFRRLVEEGAPVPPRP